MIVETVAYLLVAFWLLVGAFFALVGSLGLIKLDQPMNRLHAPTKIGTMGVGAILLASMIHAAVLEQGWMHEILILAFLFVTAPISANFISKVNIHRGNCETPPPPENDKTWSTLNAIEADQVEISPLEAPKTSAQKS